MHSNGSANAGGNSSSPKKHFFVVITQVVVMVEGHPYQGVISRHLRTRYGARGFPFFIIDSDRYGYLTKVVRHSLNLSFPACICTSG